MGLPVPVAVAAHCWIALLAVVTAFPQEIPVDTSPQPDNPVTYYIYPTAEAIDTPFTDDTSVLLEGQTLTMVIHGFRGDHTARSMHVIKEALLMVGKTNVVVVDWSTLADDPDDSALQAYHNVRDHGVAAAAASIAGWIQGVLETKGISAGDVHLVGFSLGAHVSGIIGQNLNSSVGRITGLDPPRFGYEKVAHSLRLDKGDAQFVNAMHTSGGILSYTEEDPIGHVDFFPNGDTVPQKGCPYESPIDIITCSHYMAFSLFAESVFHNNALIGTSCDKWKNFKNGHCKNNTQAPMGYPTPATLRGKFFMKTNSEPPFGVEDPDNPLPDHMKRLMVYNTSEAFIQPQDVVNFLTPGKKKGGSGPQADAPVVDDSSGVMRVKGGSKTTTTPDPPSFLSSGGSSLWTEAIAFLLTSVAGYNLLQLAWDWWTS